MSAVFGFECIAGYLQWAGGMTLLILMDKFHASSLQTSWISACSSHSYHLQVNMFLINTKKAGKI